MSIPSTTPQPPTSVNARSTYGLDRSRAVAVPKLEGVIIRVVIAGAEALVRAQHTAVLNAVNDVSVVDEAGTSQEAMNAVERFRPDVLIMDVSMPDLDGRAVAATIGASGKVTRVLALTADDEAHFTGAIKAGAGGCLLKSASGTELVDAVRAVAHGHTYWGARPARVVSCAADVMTPEIKLRAVFERLTYRERGVLLLIAQGFSAREIGEQLFISAKTVDTYKQRIQLKTGLAHRPQYIQFALTLGVLEIGRWNPNRRAD